MTLPRSPFLARHFSEYPTNRALTALLYRRIHIGTKRGYRGGVVNPSQARLPTLAQLLNCVAESLLSEGPFSFSGLHHSLAILVANGQVSAVFDE